MQGSTNVTYKNLQNEDGTFKKPEDLKKVFDEHKVDISKPIVCSCTSGVSACVQYVALQALGCKDVAVYDGSWSEYVSLYAVTYIVLKPSPSPPVIMLSTIYC